MNYIVLDLEWNQSPSGKSGEISRLPFEIIEIGAVKLDESLAITDSFREIVRPLVYTTLHFKTQEIVSLRQIDFECARSFPDVVFDFLEWCGDDPRFCTWGPSDLMELQRNLAYHQMPVPFPFPFFYYDIQKIFSIAYEDRKVRRSLEYAVDFLSIPKEVAFHSALSDAHYTSLIMQHLSPEQIEANSSVDYFHTPDGRKQEVYLRYDSYTKFISKPFVSKVQAMKDRIVTSTPCCACRKNAPKKIRWFAAGSRNYLCLACCETHGWLKGKIRLRQREDGRYYAVKTLKLISPEDAASILERKESLQLKRKYYTENTKEANPPQQICSTSELHDR